MLNKALKNKKGITLIALVITIIVLLILAGVTIAAITSNESTPNKAVEAKNKNEQGAAKEAITLFAANYIQEYYEKVYVDNEEETKIGYENVGKYIINKLNGKTGDYYTETDEQTQKIMVYNKNVTKKMAEGIIQDDGLIIWDDIEIIDKEDDVQLYVTNTNDSIHIKVVGKNNIKNVVFKNSSKEVVMQRTNKEEKKVFEFTTKMAYAGDYTVQAFDVNDKESQEKEFNVLTDRELTYLYNKGTISSLAGDFVVARNSTSYSGGTLTKEIGDLYFSRNCGNGQWATSGFLSNQKIDVSDYSVLTFKFKPESYMTSSNSQYPSASVIGFTLTDETPSTNMSGKYYQNFSGTRLTIKTPGTENSTLYLTEDSYNVPIGELEDNYYIGLCTVGAMWNPQKWYVYCTEIYLH